MRKSKGLWKQKRHQRHYSSGSRTINPFIIKSKIPTYIGIRGKYRNPPTKIKSVKTKTFMKVRKNYSGWPWSKKTFGPQKLETYETSDIDMSASGSTEPTISRGRIQQVQGFGSMEVYDDEIKQNINDAKQLVASGDISGASESIESVAENITRRTEDQANITKKLAEDYDSAIKEYNKAIKEIREIKGQTPKQMLIRERMEKEKLTAYLSRWKDKWSDIQDRNKELQRLAEKNRELATREQYLADVTKAAEQKRALLDNIKLMEKAEENRRKAYLESKSMFKKMNAGFSQTFGKFDFGGFTW